MNATKHKQVFLPPGVQVALFNEINRVPRLLPEECANTILELWEERNIAPDEEIEAIDRRMENIVRSCLRYEKIDPRPSMEHP